MFQNTIDLKIENNTISLIHIKYWLKIMVKFIFINGTSGAVGTNNCGQIKMLYLNLFQVQSN